MPDIFLLCRYFLNVFSSMLFLLCFVFFLFPARENGVAQHACFCTLEPELFRRRNFSKLFLNSKKKSFSNSPAWENGVAPQAGFRVLFSLRSSWPALDGACACYLQSRALSFTKRVGLRMVVSFLPWRVAQKRKLCFIRVVSVKGRCVVLCCGWLWSDKRRVQVVISRRHFAATWVVLRWSCPCSQAPATGQLPGCECRSFFGLISGILSVVMNGSGGEIDRSSF